MKLKKKVKKIILIVLIVLVLAAGGFFAYKKLSIPKKPQEVKILKSIDDYKYSLKDNKSKAYKAKFDELVDILTADEVDEEKYASKISEMFILDFYSLDNKSAKTDIGGVDFVHPNILSNFLENAENTYYKYLESNIYNTRNQKLPEVGEIVINAVEKITYAYNDTVDENAIKVNVSWTYTDESFSDYQKQAVLTFVHDGKKLYLVELK